MRGNLALAEESPYESGKRGTLRAYERAMAEVSRLIPALKAYGVNVERDYVSLRYVNKGLKKPILGILKERGPMTKDDLFLELESGGAFINVFIPSARLTKVLDPMVKSGELLLKDDKYMRTDKPETPDEDEKE